MFWPVYLSVLAVFALGPQVVLGSFKFNLSPVVQCQPVNITFSGKDANNHSVPTVLTILPLLDNVAPIQIPIPNGASNSTGIQLTFIPLAAGTRFIASLDDIKGPTATVSDVTRVLNSTTGPDVQGCFETSLPAVNFYQFNDNVGQCEEFSVTFNTPVESAPTIRAFFPRSGSVMLPPGNGSTTPNSASYMMTGFRDAETVLLFDDLQGHLQTTDLMTISGDSSSSKSCLKNSKDSSGRGSNKKKASGLPKSTVIGIAVTSVIVGLLLILLLILFLRSRRRNRRESHMQFDPALLNQKWPPDLEEKKIETYRSTPAPAPTFVPAPMAPTPPFSAEGFVRDPIYTSEKYASSIISDDDDDGRSISSWNQYVPDDQRGEPQFRQQSIDEDDSASRLSMGTVEMQTILQMATVHRSRSAATTGGPAPQLPSTAGTSMVAKPPMARLASTPRNRDSDIPNMPVTLSRNNSTEAAMAGVPTKYRSSYVGYGDDEEEQQQGRAVADNAGVGSYPTIPSYKTSNLRPRDSWVP
ncbi:hypothetical protein R3P38DRAFT_2687846 [Favolaschia claudopus]|uniref:Uncharacterized protein n=1 Tax=Favolaschia claudopus TaxID=2862362 RepID=A0AAW0DBG3_9AGAR